MKRIYSLLAALLVVGGMWASTTITLVVSDHQATSFTSHGITVEAAQADAANPPVYNANSKDLRIYANGTLTVSCDQQILGMSFDLSDQGKRRLAPLTVNTGSVEVMGDPDFSVTWAGSANSVTFTVGATASYGTESTKAGQFDFTAIHVTIDGDVPVDTVGPVDPSVHGDTLTCSQAYDHTIEDGDSAIHIVKAYVTKVGSYYNGKLSLCLGDQVGTSVRMFWAEDLQCPNPDDIPEWGDLVWVKGQLTESYDYGKIAGTVPGGTFGFLSHSGDAVFYPSDFDQQGVESEGGEVYASRNGTYVYVSKGYGKLYELRVYSGSVFEISAYENEISKIRFAFSDEAKRGGLKDEEIVNAQTWRINSMPSQARLTKIEVFYADGTHEALEMPDVQEKTVKFIRNGQLIIERNGVKYNVTGQIL